MTSENTVRCAIYTRKSTEKGLEQEFNSLDAQREACEAYIASQRHEGWVALPDYYDDPGFSGGNIDRPGLKKLMRDIERGKIDCVAFYKLDRLSRSLLDFVKIAEFERAISAERVRDKIAATEKKGKYLGGTPAYGYDVDYKNTKLVVNPEEAKLVRHVFKTFIETGSCLEIARKKNKVVYRYYACSSAIKNGYSSCSVKSVPAGEIEKAVVGQLRALLQSPEVIAEMFRAARDLHEHELLSLRDEKADMEMRMVELRASASELVSADSDGDVGTERFSELDDDIQRTRCMLAGVDERTSELIDGRFTEQDVADALRKLDPVWDELFPSEQHRILRSLVERVTVFPNGLDIQLRAEGIHSIVAEVKGSESGERTGVV